MTVLHGGRTSGRRLRDTWEFDGADWRQVADESDARANHMMAYDTVRNMTVVFGGTLGNGSVTDSTVLFDGTWHAIAPTRRPPARRDAGMTFDEKRGVCGYCSAASPIATGVMDDTWEFDGQDWTEVFPAHRSVGPPELRHGLRSHPQAGRDVRRL